MYVSVPLCVCACWRGRGVWVIAHLWCPAGPTGEYELPSFKQTNPLVRSGGADVSGTGAALSLKLTEQRRHAERSSVRHLDRAGRVGPVSSGAPSVSAPGAEQLKKYRVGSAPMRKGGVAPSRPPLPLSGSAEASADGKGLPTAPTATDPYDGLDGQGLAFQQ